MLPRSPRGSAGAGMPCLPVRRAPSQLVERQPFIPNATDFQLAGIGQRHIWNLWDAWLVQRNSGGEWPKLPTSRRSEVSAAQTFTHVLDVELSLFLVTLIVRLHPSAKIFY